MADKSEIAVNGRLPVVRELLPAPTPESVFRRLCALPHCLFLDSAMKHATLGRYSYIAVDPFDFWSSQPGRLDALQTIRSRLSGMTSASRVGLPPFQGGVAGLLSYDLNRSFERLPVPLVDEFKVPALALGLYDVIVAFDHLQHRAWIISQGFPCLDPAEREARAEDRLAELSAWLDGTGPEGRAASRPADDPVTHLAESDLIQQYPVSADKRLTSLFNRHSYCAAIREAIEYIFAGDVFQVNVAQRLLHPALDETPSLYLRLRNRNPAPFCGYFDMGTFQIASTSPECFVRVDEGRVETRPIKGTRPRCRVPEADLFAADDLRASEKDRAENVMIVDLMRNDLARVCLPESVQVTQLCGLELYQYVQHLVSVIQGRLSPEHDTLDLIRAAFPGGSITGAPKVRAMEIIAELEPVARGPYCGSLGYLGFDGATQLSILIRTVTAGRGWWQLPVGGGIVAQSVPEREYEETWQKARGMVLALT